MKTSLQRVDKKELRLKGIKEIVVLGDVGCTGFNEDSKKIFDEILRIKASLFFIMGDIAFSGKNPQFDEFITFCNERLTAPAFALCGNHDIPGYAGYFGRSSYALIFDHAACLFLDNSKAHFQERDLKFLKEELEKYKEKRFIILFHIPPPVSFNRSCMGADEWGKLRRVLDAHKEKIECIICAHIHGYYNYRLDGYNIFITAGGGAAMIYDLPREELKAHNYLKLSLHGDASINIAIKRIVKE
ncbi:MAG: metallophosphoesterase family protein [Candidatus Omnitrophica bacterium]|nr:metallophosphoesterase family protein [Candidatus Omnitrophota bacterium]